MTELSTPSVRLYYFRHGETEWSSSRRHTGRSEIPLTPHGEEQALALRHRIETVKFARVLSSPRSRALATCKLSGASDHPEIEPDAAEWDYGDYDGLLTRDIHRDRPGWDIYRDGCPNGETPVEVTTRADRLIARIQGMGGDVALFAHGQIGVVLAARWIGLDILKAQHLLIDPASMGVLSFDPDHPGVPVIALWNSPSLATRIAAAG